MSDKPKRRLTKADTDAYFERLQEKQREKREHKITKEEVAERFEQVRERRARKERRFGLSTLFAGAILFVAFVIGMVTVFSNQQFAAVSAKNEKLITQLEQQLKAKQQQTEAVKLQRAQRKDGDSQSETPVSPERMQALMKRIRAMAEEVAQHQNRLRSLVIAADKASSNNGAPSPLSYKASAYRKNLAPYFVKDTFVIKGDDAYKPFTTQHTYGNELDPRYPWFSGYEKGPAGKAVPLDTDKARWRVSAVYASENMSGVIIALWVNENLKNGKVYAWATGRYSVSDTGTKPLSDVKFEELSVVQTTYGDEHTLQNIHLEEQ